MKSIVGNRHVLLSVLVCVMGRIHLALCAQHLIARSEPAGLLSDRSGGSWSMSCHP